MTFAITFRGTPGVRFAAHIAAEGDFGRRHTDEEVIGTVPTTVAADGTAVSIEARITSGSGELEIVVRRGDLVRSARTEDPSIPAVVAAVAPRSAYVSFRSKRRQRRALGGR